MTADTASRPPNARTPHDRAPILAGAPNPGLRVIGLDSEPVPYARGLALQREAAARLAAHTDHGTLILLEHEAVFTAGRRSTPDEYPRDGTPVIPVDRGGRVTWHGPGQLVAYPIVRLATGVGVVDCVRALEEALLATAAAFGVHGHRVDGRSGAWARPDAPVKFAQVGIHASAGIITHGLALNCSNTLAPFAQFVPCGITDAGVSSLSELAGTTITPADAAPILRTELRSALAELTA